MSCIIITLPDFDVVAGFVKIFLSFSAGTRLM